MRRFSAAFAAERCVQTKRVAAVKEPPDIESRVQLGHTLRFHLDYFFTHPSREIEPVLAAVGDLADDLNKTIERYDSSLRERGGPTTSPK